MFHCLNEILELCLNFCSLVSQSVASLDERGTAQLDILVKVKPLISSSVSCWNKSKYVYVYIYNTDTFIIQGFRRQSSLLFKILSSVRNHQINSDLAQLLLRLDYNKYYTQAGGTLGR